MFDAEDAVWQYLVYRADNSDDTQTISDHLPAVEGLRYGWGGLALGMVELTLAQQYLAQHQALPVHQTDSRQLGEIHSATKQHLPLTSTLTSTLTSLRTPEVNIEVSLHYFIDALRTAAVK